MSDRAKSKGVERQLPVYARDGSMRIVLRANRARAELFEALGAWRREYDLVTGAMAGFRIVGDERENDANLRSIHTTAGISAREMELNCCRSNTRGLRELDRLKLIKAGEAPEDEVERVQAKVRVYAMVGPAQGDILRAWPR
jgi:hypothetical protein